MKTKLFLFAVAAAALASCSNDETVAVNQGEAITFRPLVNSSTRAADITSASNLQSFNVYAFEQGTTTSPFIDNVKFTGPTTYSSQTKYYWQNYNLDFYAWSAHSTTTDASSQVSTTVYNSYVVTPNTDAANQADFIYATAANVTKNTSGIPLTFSHKESRILVKVKNTDSALSFQITGWKLGFMAPNGTFNGSTWAPASAAATNVYTSDFTSSAQTINYDASATTQLTGSQIMIPQGITGVTAYASSETNALVNNAYIGIEYTATYISSSTEKKSKIWGIWPIPNVTWEAGKQYTYVIDLAGGGYYEKNKADTDEKLDPIFENVEIKFVNVTVDDWITTAPAGDQNVNM